MLGEWFGIELFQFMGSPISLGRVILFSIISFLSFIIFFVVKNRSFKILKHVDEVDSSKRKKFYRILLYIFIAIVLLIAISLFNCNLELIEIENNSLKLALLIQAFLIVQIARIIDWTLSNLIINKYYDERESTTPKEKIKRETNAKSIIPWIVYVFAFMLILKKFNLDPTIFSTEYDNHTFNFRVSNILMAILVFLFARLLIWVVTQIFLYTVYKQKEVEVGRQFAFNQLLSYVIYVVAAILALQYLGINMTLIWGGAAALLVGVGLGLQETFNDLFSGILLLFDRAVKVGDVLNINGFVGTIRKIGLRSSIFETYGNTTKIIPNRILVNTQVISYSYNNQKVRFQINIGVAYGSDTALVKKLLLQVTKANPYLADYPAPFVRFEAFGDSALDFSVYFFTRNFMVIEDVKSDLRFEIDRLFRENNISIPFPQREVWVRKED